MVKSAFPDFNLDDEARGKLVWLSEDAGVDLSGAIRILIRIYRINKTARRSLILLQEIVALRNLYEEKEIDLEDLRNYVADRITLQEHNLAIEDMPRVIQVATALAEVGLTYEDCDRALQLRNRLKEAEVEFKDLEQLRKDIEAIHKLAQAPEKEIKEIASWLEEKKALAQELMSVRGNVTAAKKQLDTTRQETAKLINQKKALVEEKAQLRQELGEAHEQIVRTKQTIDELSTIEQKKARTLNYVFGLEELLLSGTVSKYHGIWPHLRDLLDEKIRQDYWSAKVPPKLEEEVRKDLFYIIKDYLDPDLVSTWTKEHYKKQQYVKAIEELVGEIATYKDDSQTLHKLVEKLWSGASKFLKKVEAPILAY